MRHLTSLVIALSLLSGCVVGIDGEVGEDGDGTPTTTPTGPGGNGGGGDGPGDTRVLPPGKIAVVLAHGLGGSADSFDPAIVAAIEANGHIVKRTAVPGIESVAVRAAALGPQIDALMTQTGATKVHIIAHSMGGLDARHLVAKLGYGTKVASITTVSTPHRGSPLADLALGITQSSVVSQSDALEAIVEFVGGGIDTAALNRALFDLSETQAPTFNAANPDVPGVKYQSYAGFSTPNGISNPNAAAACTPAPMPEPAETRALLLLAQPIVASGTDRNPNDGVVEISSSTWTGFLGCISADHLGETTVPAAGEVGLDTPAFYKAIVAKLAP